MICPLRSEADYDAALVEIDRYFDKSPEPGTPAANRFNLLALVIEEYERKNWPIEGPVVGRNSLKRVYARLRRAMAYSAGD